MPKLPLTIGPKKAGTFQIEIDADRFERLAAGLGLFGKDFLKSLDRAEADIRRGRVNRLQSLRDLR